MCCYFLDADFVTQVYNLRVSCQADTEVVRMLREEHTLYLELLLANFVRLLVFCNQRE